MQPARVVALAACSALLGALPARPARAAEQACAAPIVEGDSGLLRRWPRLPERVRSALAGRSELDTCASIWLRGKQDSIMLEVRLKDGRAASRRVPGHDDVVPALEALLMVPLDAIQPPEAGPAPVEARPPSPIRPASARRHASPTNSRTRGVRTGVSEREGPVPESEPAQLTGVSLSLVGSLRMGDGQTSESVGAISLVEIASWLVGFEGRLANTEPQNYETAVEAGADEDPLAQTTLDFSVLGGHRFETGGYALDLLVGPSIVVQRVSEVDVGPAGETRSSTTGALPRLVFGSYFRIGSHSNVGAFMGIEGALGPRGGTLAPLPAWLIGLALGATLGTK